MKNLILLDICGLLCDKYNEIDVKAEFFDFKTSKNHYVCKRPYLNMFFDFVFSHFSVGIWSSMNEEDTNEILLLILSDSQYKELKLILTQEDCDIKGYLENGHPIYLKNLNRLLSQTQFINYKLNILLIDDTPYKSILNPEHTSIHVKTYCCLHKYDNELIDLKNFLMKSIGKNINIKNFLNKYKYNRFDICDKLRLSKRLNELDQLELEKIDTIQQKKVFKLKTFFPKLFLIVTFLNILSKRYSH